MLADKIHQPLSLRFEARSIATERDALQQVFSPSWAREQACNAVLSADRTTWGNFVDGVGKDFVSSAPAEPYSSGIKQGRQKLVVVSVRLIHMQ